MLQLRSYLKVADNSGAKTIGVIKVIKQGKEPGDEIFRKIKNLEEQIDDLSDSLAPGKQKDLQS